MCMNLKDCVFLSGIVTHKLAEALSHRLHAHLVINLSFRTTAMRSQHDHGPMVHQEVDCWDSFFDASLVSNGPIRFAARLLRMDVKNAQI